MSNSNTNEEYDLVYNHNEAIYISQDAEISVMNIDEIAPLDYHLHLNINGNIISGNYTDTNSNNSVLTVKHNINIQLINGDYSSTLDVHDEYGGNKTLTSEDRIFGFNGEITLKDALVGVISKALFDNFAQRAAISNDMFIEQGMYDSINNTITQIFANYVFQDRIFRRYVASGRYDDDDTNDINDVINYNLTDGLFRFGISFYGHVNERETNDTLLSNSGNEVLEGAGYHSNGLTIINITSDELIANFNDSSYQFNVLLQFRQTV